MESTAEIAIPLKVSFRALLALYLALPLCFVIYLADIIFFNGAFKREFPAAPETYFVTALFFGVPHIIASNFILATNSEYLRFYKWRLLTGSLVIVSAMLLMGRFLSPLLQFVILAVATIIHVVRQQLGIGNILAKQSGPIYQTWYWSVILGSVVMYLGVFVGGELADLHLKIMNGFLIGFATVIFVTTIIIRPRIKNSVAQAYFLGNAILALAGLFFYSQKYLFLAILGGRIVHDMTAFIFYMTHDRNRHLYSPKNFVYRILNRFFVHPFLAVPWVAILIAFVLQFRTEVLGPLSEMSMAIVIYLTYLHYYTESFTWKGDSPYRKHISFKL